MPCVDNLHRRVNRHALMRGEAMIDLTAETVLSLTEAAKTLPKRRAGKRPHVATLYRWAKRGLRGVKLETIQVGGTLCTSTEALQRFFEQLGAPATATDRPATLSRARLLQEATQRLRDMNV